MKTLPIILTIAGTDPSGGAGIQADIKTISATGGYAASVITALVAQNTQGVDSIYEIDANFIYRQLHCVFNDLNVSAVKIGMLYNKEIIQVVADALEKFKAKNIVLDPVMFAKSGDSLINFENIEVLKQKLLPKVTLITPNIPECEHLLDNKINDFSKMQSGTKKLSQKYNINVLLKGGHLYDTNKASDVLYEVNKKYHVFESEWINTSNTHGTGCTLSSAIASYLAQGLTLKESVNMAKIYLTNAVKAASFLKIGKGNGPLEHFYNFRK